MDEERTKTESGSWLAAERKLAKRDFLIAIENEMANDWEDKAAALEGALWETNAPKEAEEEAAAKYMVTAPPLCVVATNGGLGLQDVFTASKAEFAAGHQRLKGKRVLFSLGFHGTGVHVQACADRIKSELELYGCPPQFPSREPAIDPGSGVRA
jgi:leucyl-tRNA synthetase